MIHYNIPCRVVGQAPAGDARPVSPPGAPWPHRQAAGRPWRLSLVAAASAHAVLITVLLLVVGAVVQAPPITPVVQMAFIAPTEPALAAEPSAVAPAPATSAEAMEPPPPPEEKPPTPMVQPSPPQTALPPEATETAPVPPPPTTSAVPEPTPRPRPAAVSSPPRPRPQHLQAAKPVVPQSAPSAPSAPEAPAATAAPATAAAPASLSPGWRQALAGWLARHKSYPEEARRRGVQGTVLVRFAIDRDGKVVDVAVLRGSGSPLLDDVTVAMLRGATVPAPSGLTGDQITVSVQVHYALTDQ